MLRTNVRHRRSDWDVTLEDLTSELATIAVEGPGAAEALAHVGAPTPEVLYSGAAWDQSLIARMTFTGSGFFVIVPMAKR